MIRPAIFTISVQLETPRDYDPSDPSNSSNFVNSIDISAHEEGRDMALEWLEKDEPEGFLRIKDVDGDMFCYRADLVRSVEILRDTP